MAARWRAVATLVPLLLVPGCDGEPPAEPAACGEARAELPVEPPRSWAPERERAGHLLRFARVEGDRLVVSLEGGETDFVPGVNVGGTVPGTFPGELAAGADEYRRWFPMIASLGLRAVRVYTILPPAFYEELAAYNEAHPAAPLLLVQGVWAPEEALVAAQDAWAPEVASRFDAEIRDAVAVLAGSADLPERPGRAGGRFRADMRPWLLAMALGVEWDPLAVRATDRAHGGERPYSGEWVTATADATPMESWLARALDTAAAELAGRDVTVPLTFTNWVTTDPLRHPDEPLAYEDMVGIDAEHVRARRSWPAGVFASYHVYPYYPDFMRLAEGDGWRAELEALLAHHSMPVMVTEFGVPSGLGLAHRGAAGRDQGRHSEAEQMAVDAEMLCTISSLGFAGGFLFEWADEWFKLTWNTRELERPAERRQLWKNALTNEEHFGLLATDPAGGAEPRVHFESRRHVREVKVGHDEGVLRVVVTLDGDWDETGVRVELPDHAVEVTPEGTAQASVRGRADPFAALHAPEAAGAEWADFRLPWNLEPLESVNVGELPRGTWWTAKGSVVELRLPWALAGMADPSSLTALTVEAPGRLGARRVEGLPMEVSAGGHTASLEYRWEGWNRVEWDERLKDGVELLAGAVESTLAPAP